MWPSEYDKSLFDVFVKFSGNFFLRDSMFKSKKAELKKLQLHIRIVFQFYNDLKRSKRYINYTIPPSTSTTYLEKTSVTLSFIFEISNINSTIKKWNSFSWNFSNFSTLNFFLWFIRKNFMLQDITTSFFQSLVVEFSMIYLATPSSIVWIFELVLCKYEYFFWIIENWFLVFFCQNMVPLFKICNFIINNYKFRINL